MNKYLLSEGHHCTKFGNFRAKGSKAIEQKTCTKTKSLTFDLKINREHLLSMGNHFTMFGNVKT